MDDLTTGKKVLLHLSQCSRREHEVVYPPEMTQDGIADKLGVSQGNGRCS